MRRLRSLLALPAALACAGTAAAQGTLRLSLADAVHRAAAQAPGVQIAGLVVEESEAHVQQARAAFLPRVDAGAAWMNRVYNRASLGLQFPSILGSRSSQTVSDLSICGIRGCVFRKPSSPR